uniref:Phostensin/Taperin PP1-binding domain-containing protein n=1 Tax=Stegastes partitus TaxID=144197 RepID=A0A3B4ZXP2_9TELE
MSVSSLPEWKQLLLEKKRREEEERERREKEEEEKFASMPAWKRGIIQRRKMKQESLGDREKERDAYPGLWLDAEPKLVSQVSVETIVPVHENPFIRTQSAWRKDRDGEVGSQDGESGRGRDIEVKIERFRDLSEGREKERSRDRSEGRENSREGCEKDKIQWKELAKDAAREQEVLKVRLDTEEKDAHPPSGPFPPNVPCLRTIRADNIIIIEQDRKSSDERRGRWRQVERERPEEENQGKRGMKMDLREILAGGGSVTEIRASETQKKDEETTGPNPKVSLQRASSPSSQIKQTITIAPSLLRSQSPDNTLKPVDCTPTPASSPSSPSPSPTPSVSPSPNPSPTLFSIRSASGGQVKRGATITITPKKPVGGGTTVSVGRPIAAGSTSKKYPTVEEIEVIGGYQNLEKSCLVKNRGIPKRGKVCFDEDQLEQVCEYPSETFLLTFSPFPHGGAPLGRMERLQGEEAQEEEGEVEAGPVVLKSTRSTGITTGPRLRVGQCHPLLKKHKV